MGQIDRRERIRDLAEALKELPQVDCPVVHRFAPGCYLRQILMPAGTLVVGKIHATEHFNIILKGKCTVATRDGVETFEAPATFVSEAGVQKVVFNHTDVIWQTVHVTEETDLEKLEEKIIVKDFSQLEVDAVCEKLQEAI